MRRGKVILVSLVALAALVAAPGAVAQSASVEEICADVSDGKLDGAYTEAELAAYQRSAWAQVYCAALPSGPSGVAGGGPGGAEGGEGPLGAEGQQGDLPFTGLDLALFAIAGLALVASGVLLRRSARNRS